ncbi:MAG: SpoIID/LytB domain-containing protein, partial [bacterium]
MNKIIRKIIIQTFTLFLAFTIIFISVNAQTLSDIDQQIKIAKEQKAAREAELNQAQTLLKTLQNKSYSVSTDINTLKSQITDLENQTSQVKNQISELEKNIKKTQDDMDLFKAQRNEQISQYFMDSSMDSTIEDLLNSASSIGEYQTLSEIKTFSIGNKKQQLDEVSENFVKLNEEKKQVEQLKADLELQNSSLAQKKQELETALYSINNNIGSTTANANSIKSQLSGLNSSLGQLDSQRKDLLNAELQKMANNQQTTQVPLQDGQYFFMGRGRDLYDGHGLGMSQWGAYNMAQLGYTWDKILTYYYQNTTIGNYSEPAMIVVDGKTGPITFDDYLAGIGEVPDYWPDESIKAQVVAARTYAMRSAAIGSDGYSHICGTDSCQVFRGTSAKSCTADNLANFPSQVGAKCKETLATKG